MDGAQVQRVRSFNRLVTQRVGALDESYLKRGRPLGEARLLFEVGPEGADLRALRDRLALDSGYLSRLLNSLTAQGLVEVGKDARDGRLRRAILTRKGRAERERLVAAMGEVERLLRAGRVEISFEAPASADAKRCLHAYFREIAVRFESGFDRNEERSGSDDDLGPPGGCFVVARLEGEAIGCGGFKRVDAATGLIKRVWTAPSARGLGVARRMLRTLEGVARDAGLTTLRLDTNKALTEAHALYRKEGYREIERFNDNPYSHHWFEKRL
jgi:GNAT superfamily N-acetyltransferase